MERRTLMVMGLALLISQRSIAQDWNRIPGGNNINSTEWLGADVGSTVPLRIETRANEPIDWYTNAIRRITLLPDASYPIATFPPQVKDGSLLLSPDVDQFYSGAFGPYSLLHVAAATNSTQQQSYREWMNTGVTLTGNEDHAYWGLKEADLDYTDVVLHWSDIGVIRPRSEV